MIRYKTIVILALIIILAAGTVFSQNTAVIRRIVGKVEIQRPEEGWIPAAVGMELPLGATISTGFNSQAVLEIGSSVLTLRALTRIRIEELQVRDNVAVTGLSMPVGRIRAEVRSTEGLSTDFRVRSPVSTAAVRGSGIDTNGDILDCFDDRGILENAAGIGIEVYENERGKLAELNRPSGGTAQQEERTTRSPYTRGLDKRNRGITGFKGELGEGGILIKWTR